MSWIKLNKNIGSNGLGFGMGCICLSAVSNAPYPLVLALSEQLPQCDELVLDDYLVVFVIEPGNVEREGLDLAQEEFFNTMAESKKENLYLLAATISPDEK